MGGARKITRLTRLRLVLVVLGLRRRLTAGFAGLARLVSLVVGLHS